MRRPCTESASILRVDPKWKRFTLCQLMMLLMIKYAHLISVCVCKYSSTYIVTCIFILYSVGFFIIISISISCCLCVCSFFFTTLLLFFDWLLCDKFSLHLLIIITHYLLIIFGENKLSCVKNFLITISFTYMLNTFSLFLSLSIFIYLHIFSKHKYKIQSEYNSRLV